MNILNGIEPAEVFRFFEEISRIPHGSYDTKRISDYCVRFAGERGLLCTQDKWNNVVIVKEASAGYEEAETVMIQGHLDMVCEKDSGSDHDFSRDPLQLCTDGTWLWAEHTTLGGDDGIAVAYALAILNDDSLHHPRLEVVLTTEEEVGMDGAKGLDTSALKATRMLNIDSDEEGILLTGCAGGFCGECTIEVKRTEYDGVPYELKIHGLLGGHSGMEINKGRLNANKVMARILNRLDKSVHFRITTLSGGAKDNVIPKEACAELLIREHDIDQAETELDVLRDILRREYQETDPGVSVSFVKKAEPGALALSVSDQAKVLHFLLQIPNGVMRMSPHIKGLVQTSLNLCAFALEENRMRAGFAVRSSSASEKEELSERLESFMKYLGGSYRVYGEYPAWEYRAESGLREIMVELYREQYGEEPQIEAIHAGLECGVLIDKMGDVDCISFGPDMLDIHTPDERLNIASAGRVWNYLVRVLESLK